MTTITQTLNGTDVVSLQNTAQQIRTNLAYFVNDLAPSIIQLRAAGRLSPLVIANYAVWANAHNDLCQAFLNQLAEPANAALEIKIAEEINARLLSSIPPQNPIYPAGSSANTKRLALHETSYKTFFLSGIDKIPQPADGQLGNLGIAFLLVLPLVILGLKIAGWIAALAILANIVANVMGRQTVLQSRAKSECMKSVMDKVNSGATDAQITTLLKQAESTCAIPPKSGSLWPLAILAGLAAVGYYFYDNQQQK